MYRGTPLQIYSLRVRRSVQSSVVFKTNGVCADDDVRSSKLRLTQRLAARLGGTGGCDCAADVPSCWGVAKEEPRHPSAARCPQT